MRRAHPQSIGIRVHFALAVGLLALLLCIILGTVGYLVRRATLLRGIDDKLLVAAHLAAAVPPEGYYDRIVDRGSVSKAEFERIVDRHNQLCLKLGLQYLWSCMVVDGKIVFTTATSPSKDVRKGDHASFFEEHRDPHAFDGVFRPENLRALAPHYSSFKNEWGHGRMVLVPALDSRGRAYCYGASVSVEGLRAELSRTLWWAVGGSGAVLAAGVLLSVLVAGSMSRPIVRLTRVAEAIARGEPGEQELVEPRASHEIRSLAHALATMRQAIQEKLAALRAEIAERVRAQEQASREAVLLQAINEILQTSLRATEESEVARMCLAVAERVTGSSFGFVGELNPRGRFDTLALSDPGWAECKMPKPQAVRLIHDMEVRGLLGQPLLTGETILTNAPASHPAAVGVPEGHPALTSFLGVPLTQAGRTIGMIGLANKPGGYTHEDQETVEALSVAFVEALMRKRAEVAVRRARNGLELRVKQRTAQLARSNAELEQLAYVAAHDLREPLRMISSFVELLAQRYQDKLDDKGREYIGYIADGARRMEAMIDDLLDYARVMREGKPFQPVPCEELLEEVLRDLSVAIAETGAQVTHDPLPTVHADGIQLARVLRNLIGNAIKFHGPKPPCVHLRAVQKDHEWVFSVRDNGIGIDPQQFQRIFKMFQRLHTGAKYPGTGMGLALCKTIIERHRGRIWVESEPGRGSTFYFTIPVSAVVD